MLEKKHVFMQLRFPLWVYVGDSSVQTKKQQSQKQREVQTLKRHTGFYALPNYHIIEANS